MGSSRGWPRIAGRNWRPSVLLALLAAALGGAPALSAPAPDREAWRKVVTGRVTVVGTASDVRLVETAVTLRALVALLPGFVPGAFDGGAPLRVAVVHDPGHLARVGVPEGDAAAGRGVLAATTDEEARGALLRNVVRTIAGRARAPLPAWLVEGLAEYVSTFSATGTRATLGRLVPEHVTSLRGARPQAGRPALLATSGLERDEEPQAFRSAESWSIVHFLLHGTPDGEERLGRFAALLSEGREETAAFRDAFGEGERALLARALAHVRETRPLARFVPVPAGAPPVGRILPLTRAGAAAILGGVVKGRRAPEPEAPESPEVPGRAAPPIPALSSASSRPSVAVSRDVPSEVDLVNRLLDDGREEEALARLEALHASLGRDPEMQRALGWDVQEVKRVVVHNRLVRRYNEAIGLLNAGRRDEAIPLFREVAASAEDPSLRRLAWEQATAVGRPR